MSLFVCPICGEMLKIDGSRYYCAKKHSFDIASEGYVNLLTVDRRHSQSPGDDKAMARARRAFLDKGYYSELLQALCEETVKRAAADEITILDAGCGEGYYTSGICCALADSGISANAAGIDISKDILKSAAKRERRVQERRHIEYAVASSFHLPLCNESVDILLNCFSPLALDEFLRVLRPGGYFIYVVPAAGHLWELKQVLYDKPYPNEEKNTPYDGFIYDTVREVKMRITIDCNDDIMNLFTMTPYFWRTPQSGTERLKKLASLETAAEFRIHIFKKL